MHSARDGSAGRAGRSLGEESDFISYFPLQTCVPLPLPGPTAPTERAGRTGVEFAKDTLERAGDGAERTGRGGWLAVLEDQGAGTEAGVLGLRRCTGLPEDMAVCGFTVVCWVLFREDRMSPVKQMDEVSREHGPAPRWSPVSRPSPGLCSSV